MKAVIAEKPSVARDLARILGANKRYEGYMEGNGYRITYAFGHLITLALPEEYGIESFQKESLPIIPDPFKLVPRQIKTEKGYKPDSGTLKQLKIIRDVFDSCDEIIVATDAGREGELIFRFIFNFLGCTKPFSRLWINSLTDKSIREGFQNLKKGTEYDNLYLAAKMRSEADWLIGINSTQAISIAAGRGTYSLGRVQTPTLAMICSRYLENKRFVPEKYWTLSIGLEKDTVSFKALFKERFSQKEEAEKLYELLKISGKDNVQVKQIEQKDVTQEPPLLHDLTSLQKEANQKYGFSADKTLGITQNLYESKLITYPRTGSRYISADIMDEVPILIDCLKSHPRLGEYAKTLDHAILNIRPVDDKKVTDHHALLITDEPPMRMSKEEYQIYDLIAGRMLEAFSKKCIKKVTTIQLICCDHFFEAKGSIIKQAGWRGVFGTTDEKTDDETENVNLPELKENELLTTTGCSLIEKTTKPKPLHTESSLLSAMENAGKELEDENQRKAMKECGLGTPATRAAIIETLFTREYIIRDNKSLLPTEKGLAVYGIVKNMRIANPEMTGYWEEALAKIESGEMDPATFRKSIEIYTTQITTELLSSNILFTQKDSEFDCPKCKKHKLKFYNKVVKCSDEQCDFVIFRNKSGKQLSDEQIKELLTKGKTGIIKGFSSKDCKPFDTSLAFDDSFNLKFVFPEKKRFKKK